MRRIAGWLLLGTLVWIPASLQPASAQQASPQLKLELQVARKRPEVPVAPDPKVAEQAAERAVAEIQARERSEELIRETFRAPSRRPDLHYDVWSGIQARSVSDALRRR